MKLLCSLVLAAATCAVQEPAIHTIAGNGTFFGPEPGAVALGSPITAGLAMAVDRQDRVYITTIDGAIWRINADGRWEKLWSTPDGLLFGLTVDAQGRVYAADGLAGRVYRIDPDGSSLVVAGSGIRGYSGDGGRAAEASLDVPTGLAADEAGNLFILADGRIRVVNAEGLISTYFGEGFAWSPSGGLGLDASGNLYVADFSGAVLKITPDRQAIQLAGGNPGDPAVRGPLAATVCPDGSAYFTDFYRLQRATGGVAEVIAGSLDRAFAVDDGPARDARFLTPLAVACESQNRIYVLDSTAFRIRQVSSGATVAE